jgi:hypothetical protein
MRRREFITLLGGAAVIWSSAGIAQQPKVPTIGVLVVGSPGSGRFWQLFRELMRELGYVEGRSIRYEFRSDESARASSVGSGLPATAQCRCVRAGAINPLVRRAGR